MTGHPDGRFELLRALCRVHPEGRLSYRLQPPLLRLRTPEGEVTLDAIPEKFVELLHQTLMDELAAANQEAAQHRSLVLYLRLRPSQGVPGA